MSIASFARIFAMADDIHTKSHQHEDKRCTKHLLIAEEIVCHIRNDAAGYRNGKPVAVFFLQKGLERRNKNANIAGCAK